MQHVPEDAGLLIIGTPPLHPQCLGGGDLDVVDVVVVPEGLKEGIAKADGQDVPDHLLAQVVVNAVDLAFLQRLGNALVKRPGAVQVRAKRLFYHHPVAGVAPLGQAVFMQMAHHRLKMLRRHRQEEQPHRISRPLRFSQESLQPLEALRLADELHLIVKQPREKTLQMRLIHPGAGMGLHRCPGFRPVGCIVLGPTADGNHPAVLRQAAFRHQVVQRRQQFAVGQIPRAAKNQHRQRFPLAGVLPVDHVPRPPFYPVCLSYPKGRSCL